MTSTRMVTSPRQEGWRLFGVILLVLTARCSYDSGMIYEGPKPLVVPYPVEREGEDFGYVDLRAEPERVGQLPEVRSYPQMGDLLTAINRTRSELRSLACSVTGGFDVKIGFIWYHTSTVDVAFVDVAKNRRKRAFRDLIQSYKTSVVDKCRKAGVINRHEIKRVFFCDEKRKGYCLRLFTLGSGRGADEAEPLWEATLPELTRFFAAM